MSPQKLNLLAQLIRGKKVDQAVLMGTRLIPDMLPFSRQVQLAARFAEQSAARLAGVEVPADPANAEKTLLEVAQSVNANREVFYNLGEVKFAKGETDEAVKYYERASQMVINRLSQLSPLPAGTMMRIGRDG